MLSYIAKKVFGTRNDRVLASIKPLLLRVNDFERKLTQLSDSGLQDQTVKFKTRLENGESLEDIQAEAFATVREAARRVLGQRHYDSQIIGGAVLHRGMISEMKTGEGKTLVATLPAYLNALSGKGVHIVTVNDYLAKRDSEWMGRVHRFLGLSVGVVHHGLPEAAKREAYAADITYGQNNEFGFDYLRDNMRFSLDQIFQRGHNFAIVDEVDSILIDEARTPLIISGPTDDATELYHAVNKIIPRLRENEDFEIELRSKTPNLTEEGVRTAERLLDIQNLYDPKNISVLHHVVQALKAHTTMHRDQDYVVKDGQIIIVDEFTGRLMPGRRWGDGLHQAIEAKEGVRVQQENQTLASITFQNLFRLYTKLSGMTGTADTEAREFAEIYGLEVVIVPTNKQMIRRDESDKVFRTRQEKYQAVVNDIIEINKTGQPILVGTITIEQSEMLSRMLEAKGIKHHVLNAKHHEREAEIVAQAGRFGAVTISTNMAGRGTDILLGGNPEFLAFAEAGTKDRDDPAFISALANCKRTCGEERERVVAAGGLCIIGTERHESRRIDNQLRGRAGRQGDPGRSQFYVSLEDDLMRRFGGERLQMIMKRLGWEEGLAIDGRMISRSIESAQKKVEGFHFDSRKHVTDYDNVMSKQRQVIYDLRNRILHHEGIREELHEMISDLVEREVLEFCPQGAKSAEWNLVGLRERLAFIFGQPILEDAADLTAQNIFDAARARAAGLYEAKVKEMGAKLEELAGLTEQSGGSVQFQISRSENKPFNFTTVEEDVCLETLDHFWNAHLQAMDHLREGIGLRGYGQKNPLHEYQKEGFVLFQQMLETMKENIVRRLFFYQLPTADEIVAHFKQEAARRAEVENRMRMVHASADEPRTEAAGEGGDGAGQSETKTIDEQRARLEAQRKARRKARR